MIISLEKRVGQKLKLVIALLTISQNQSVSSEHDTFFLKTWRCFVAMHTTSSILCREPSSTILCTIKLRCVGYKLKGGFWEMTWEPHFNFY